MKISLSWINDFIDVKDYLAKPQELAKLLTDAGFEVEAVDNPGLTFQHVVVGLIRTLDRHPNADRLTLCSVDIGDGTPRQIVCGATNHKAGDKVVVALPGAVLPGNFAIKKSKIRDVESQGMLASESELGLKPASEAKGILILPTDAKIGQPFAESAGLDDVILEVNVSPNRADCLSHLGLARELSALLNRPLRNKPPELTTTASLSSKKTIRLEVLDAKLCPRYTGRVLTGIKVGPSPDVIRRRLEAVGMNSINNVVDITNYVMMEVGQPLHAFDLDHLAGATVKVGVPPAGEAFVSLDGTEIKLRGDELTIRDQSKSVCIAGVIGGKNSGVSDTTTRVFLESAHFAMDSVRRTSRRLGLQTDSAYRFSRGVDTGGAMRASELACALLQKHAGAQVAADAYDEYPQPVQAKPIAIALSDVSTRLGYAATAPTFTDWMKRIGCQVETNDQVNFKVTPPAYRLDLEMKEDLIEEYGRLLGYDKIPEILPEGGAAPLPHADEYTFDTVLGKALEIEGYHQAVNYAFLASKFQDAFNGPSSKWEATGLSLPTEAVRVRNPLNEDVNAMRVSLAPGLFRCLVYNYRQGVTEGRLFESGFVFRKSGEEYLQSPRLALIGWGQETDLWRKEKLLPFFDLKATVENLLQRLHVGGPKGVLRRPGFQSLEFRTGGELPPFLHPGQSATIFCEGKNIGYVGAIHPRLLTEEKIPVPAAIAELDVQKLRQGQPRPIKFQPISKQPAVERDLALVVPKDVASAKIAGEIRKIAGANLQSIEIFDQFEGGSLPEGHRSIAYRMVFQDANQTLTDQQLQALQNDIIAGLDQKLGVRVR